MPEIANKGVYVQEVYVNAVDADFQTIFESVPIPNNALSDYHIEFYKPSVCGGLESALIMSQIKYKGLNVVSNASNLSRNLLNELKDNNFGACLQSLAWFGTGIGMYDNANISINMLGLDDALLAEIEKREIIKQELV
jgi:hypothetical protein